MSDYQAITISPLTPHMGAEIGGLDLSRPLGTDVAAELRTALADHLVLFFRDQPIDFAAHKALARHFGEIHVAAASAAWTVPGHPEVTSMQMPIPPSSPVRTGIPT